MSIIQNIKKLIYNFLASNKAKQSSTYLIYNKLFLNAGITYNLIQPINIFANVGPKGDPMAVPSFCE